MSRPGAKKRGVKAGGRKRKHPDLSRPFPRTSTVLIEAPAWSPGESAARAALKWGAWLRVVRELKQFRTVR